MHKNTATLLLGSALTLTLFVPISTYAQDSYVKVGVGQSRYSGDGSAHATGYYLAYGTQVDSSLDVEVGYVDFGRARVPFGFEDVSASDNYAQHKTRSFYAAGIGNIPVSPTVTVQGKLGLAYHRSSAVQFSEDLVAQDVPPIGSASKVRVLLGAGVVMQFNKEVSGALEYTYFGEDGQGAKLSLLNAALRYHF